MTKVLKPGNTLSGFFFYVLSLILFSCVLTACKSTDPQLLPHDYIEIPVRSAVVRVMGSMGDVCELTHTPSVHAVRYVQVCFGNSAGPWA